MTFVLIMSIWAGVMVSPTYYRFEMPKADCQAMLKVLEAYPKAANPEIHAVCVPSQG